MSQIRRLAAILAADVAGYSRLIGADEGGTLERLKALRRELLDPKIAEHRGRLVKTAGDEPLTRETTKLKFRVLMVVILPHSHDIIKATTIRWVRVIVEQKLIPVDSLQKQAGRVRERRLAAPRVAAQCQLGRNGDYNLCEKPRC